MKNTEKLPHSMDYIIKHIKDAGLDKLYGIIIEEHPEHPGCYMNGKKIEICDMADVFGEDTFKTVDELENIDNTGERE